MPIPTKRGNLEIHKFRDTKFKAVPKSLAAILTGLSTKQNPYGEILNISTLQFIPFEKQALNV